MKKIARLIGFGKEKIRDEASKTAYKLMKEAIAGKGGRLNFSISINSEGWVAQCKEFPEIIAGGNQVNPTDDVIVSTTNEAVKTAFHINAGGEELKSSEVKIKELQLCA